MRRRTGKVSMRTWYGRLTIGAAVAAIAVAPISLVRGDVSRGACDDGNPCTDDVFDEMSNQCIFTPDDSNACSDDNPCTNDVCRAGACVCPTGACAPSPAVSFTNTTPLPIPDTAASPVLSTSTVSGLDPYLYDLDLRTALTHSFPGDLELTLTSPAGTVSSISTRNGGGADNVFNGTVWDDDADPGNQVPFPGPTFPASNLVTDTTYAANTVEPTLVPEEALGAFLGEDPNGVWAIRIRDAAIGDTGELVSWQIDVRTLTAAPIETTTSFAQWDSDGDGTADSTPQPISASGTPLVVSRIDVAGAGAQIGRVVLHTDISHAGNADLDMTLTSPAGTVVTITSDNGGSLDDLFHPTAWSDRADPGSQIPYPPVNPLIVTDHAYTNLESNPALTIEEAMAAWQGENPNGTWTLRIQDDLAPNGGTLNAWSLDITTVRCGASCATDCADGNPCTEDACSPMTGCVHAPTSGPCSDANPCTSNDACNGGTCQGTPISGPCSDDTLCTLNDVCNGGVCVGTPFPCDDANPCTIEACNPATGLCVATNATGPCDDGDLCTTDDLCGPPPHLCEIGESFDGVTVPNLPPGWTQQVVIGDLTVDAWKTVNTTSDTAPNAAGTNDPPVVTDKILATPSIAMSMSPGQLSFRNSFNLEASTVDMTTGFDGAVLEIKIGAGFFQDVIAAGGSFTAGGYNRLISTQYASPIGDRMAWSGSSSGFITTTVGLPAAAQGQTIQLRWRVATDSSVAGVGQFIDTITLSGVQCLNECRGTPIPDCVSARPCEADGVMVQRVSPASLRITWRGSHTAGALDYGIYEGTLGSWYSHGSIDCSDGGSDLTEIVPASPGDHYYLVVPRNDTSEGSYGRRSNDMERPPGAPACAPQIPNPGCFFEDDTDAAADPLNAGCHWVYSNPVCTLDRAFLQGDVCLTALIIEEWTNPVCHPPVPVDRQTYNCNTECINAGRGGGTCQVILNACGPGLDSSECVCDIP